MRPKNHAALNQLTTVLASRAAVSATALADHLGVSVPTLHRLLQELRPDHVHVLVKGRIVASGGPELAEQLERDGYAAFGDVDEPEPAAKAKAAADPFADPFA